MNIIKGLITKDILQLKSYRKTLIVFIFIFILTSITQESTNGLGNMIIIMLTLGFGMFSIATFNYDELAKADRYILTLPLTKKEVVLSKYILVMLSTILGSLIGIIISYIIILANKKQIPNIQDLISLGLGAFFAISTIESIQIPCIYKWGVEKGRIQLFIIVAAITLVIGGIFFLIKNINFQILNDLNSIVNFLPILFILITAIIYFVSYKIAYKIYKKREI